MTRRPKHVHSTGAEPTPTAPVTTQAAIGAPTSTGAEPFDDQPVTTRLSYLDEPITVHSPTPGPVTMTVGWLADTETTVEAKVIEPAEQTTPEPARTQAHTKTSRSRGRTRDR